jgi:DNA-binding GntR family transcriptional regulator
LRRLEAEGLVRIGPRRGAEVASLSRADVREIYEIRIALEPDLMRRAVGALGPADSKRLVDMSEQMDARVDQPAAGLRARRAFYSELYVFADRPRIHRLIFGLRDDVQRYHVLKNVKAALHDHAELRECIRVKDAERAAQVHAQHLRRACDDLVDALEREGSL